MPIFNCSATLPYALTSLSVQTFENWECIVVDDGSSDDPERVIHGMNDSRIRYQRLNRNHGRGFARQRALEASTGEYVAFLDGDDWIVPTKLQKQWELFCSEPDLAAVSAGMAIANVSGDLMGVRIPSTRAPVSRGRYRSVSMPPISFPAAMLPSGLAKRTGFDVSFPTAEDADFLLRALLGKSYAVLTQPLYVYCEQGTMTLSKVSSALTHCCRMFGKQIIEHPMECAIEIGKARGKQLIYHAASGLGLWDYMIARRSRTASPAEREQYQDAWRVVSAIAAKSMAAAV
jgi:glycosyltransferase involved in cell wall biosynthesis